MGTSVDRLEAMAAKLEASGDYRVLRRVGRRERFTAPDGTSAKVGVVLDVETTGLDPLRDEIVELGMVKFEFSPDGRVFRVLSTFEAFREPSAPIPPEITRLTGITYDMVEGKSINPLEVAGFVDDVAIVIAHNAAFDRRFCERAWPVFTLKAWACSMSEVNWHEEGFEGTKLGYLLAGCGLFHDGHRAAEDCRAVLEVLASPLSRSGETALKRLLDTARGVTVRIWADRAPYELREVLRVRGYRWSDGTDGGLRAWWIDVAEAELDAELAFLKSEIYRREFEPPMKRLTAFDRFSDRI